MLPELRKIEGFLGATLLRETRADMVEFLVLTRWSSMDAVRAFAGADPTRAVVESEAVAALDDFGRTVRHHEVVQETRPFFTRPTSAPSLTILAGRLAIFALTFDLPNLFTLITIASRLHRGMRV